MLKNKRREKQPPTSHSTRNGVVDKFSNTLKNSFCFGSNFYPYRKLAGNIEKRTKKPTTSTATKIILIRRRTTETNFSTYCSVKLLSGTKKNDEHFVFWFRFQYFSPPNSESEEGVGVKVFFRLWFSIAFEIQATPIRKICFISNKQRNDIG